MVKVYNEGDRLHYSEVGVKKQNPVPTTSPSPVELEVNSSAIRGQPNPPTVSYVTSHNNDHTSTTSKDSTDLLRPLLLLPHTTHLRNPPPSYDPSRTSEVEPLVDPRLPNTEQEGVVPVILEGIQRDTPHNEMEGNVGGIQPSTESDNYKCLEVIREGAPGSSEVIREGAPGSSEVIQDANPGKSYIVQDAAPGKSEVIQDADPGKSEVIQEGAPGKSEEDCFTGTTQDPRKIDEEKDWDNTREDVQERNAKETQEEIRESARSNGWMDTVTCILKWLLTQLCLCAFGLSVAALSYDLSSQFFAANNPWTNTLGVLSCYDQPSPGNPIVSTFCKNPYETVSKLPKMWPA